MIRNRGRINIAPPFLKLQNFTKGGNLKNWDARTEKEGPNTLLRKKISSEGKKSNISTKSNNSPKNLPTAGNIVILVNIYIV